MLSVDFKNDRHKYLEIGNKDDTMAQHPSEMIISPAGDVADIGSDLIDDQIEQNGVERENQIVQLEPPRMVVLPPPVAPSLKPRPFIRMPATITAPTANYYSEIKWKNGFDQWSLVRFSTQGDGSCLFHAIANSFFRPYHTEMLDGKRVSRTQMIRALRRELSEKLSAKVTSDPKSPTYYDQLNRGYTAEWAADAKIGEYSLDYMKKELDSSAYIGYGYLEFIGNALNKDIYILEATRQDIYRQFDEDLELMIKGDRSSIVLYNIDNTHYELVGVRNADGTFDTHFSPDHSLIRFLHNRVQNIILSVRDNNAE